LLNSFTNLPKPFFKKDKAGSDIWGKGIATFKYNNNKTMPLSQRKRPCPYGAKPFLKDIA
jgi:hypothetical protein